MAIVFREIELTNDQKRRLVELSEISGKAYSEILAERLSSALYKTQPRIQKNHDRARLARGLARRFKCLDSQPPFA
jgi:hypothetical protein